MIRHNPDDVHALVLNRILALPKDSPHSHAAHRDYQATRTLVIRPKLMAQKSLLERALMGNGNHDARVTELDDAIAADWFALDGRIDDWRQVHPDATEPVVSMCLRCDCGICTCGDLGEAALLEASMAGYELALRANPDAKRKHDEAPF